MSTANRHTTATRIVVTAFVAAAILVATAPAAYADQISDAKAQAASVQAQVTALTNSAEIASEAYNNAAYKYSQVSDQEAASKKQLKKLTAQKNRLQSLLDDRATSLYRQGPLGWLEVLLSARTFSDFDSAYQMMTNASRKSALTVDQLKIAKAKATTVHNTLLAQQHQAGVQKSAMASNKAAVNTKLAASRAVLASANAKVQQLIAEEKARELAAAQAAARRLAYSSGGSGSGSNIDFGPAPPASEIGKRAVWFAEKKLGCAYVWAASGPNTFDCSGLTMWAYDQVGVSLPHYSGAQIDCGHRVSRSELAPGDLVFFGDPIHHVGMYVGNNEFIEAPYTGADVRIRPLDRSDFAGACRPYAK